MTIVFGPTAGWAAIQIAALVLLFLWAIRIVNKFSAAWRNMRLELRRRAMMKAAGESPRSAVRPVPAADKAAESHSRSRQA